MSGRRTETRTIDGIEVMVQQLPYERAIAVAPRVGSLFDALAEAGTADRDAPDPCLVLLFMFGRDPQLQADLMEGVVAIVPVEGTGARETVGLNTADGRNKVLTGKLETALQIAKFSAEVNFGPLSRAVAAGVKRRAGVEEKTPASA